MLVVINQLLSIITQVNGFANSENWKLATITHIYFSFKTRLGEYNDWFEHILSATFFIIFAPSVCFPDVWPD